MARWWVCVLLVGCIDSRTVQCDFGVCPASAACDGVHGTCVQPDQLQSCLTLADGEPCTIVADADGICDQRVCVVERCGDGYVRGGEQCDGTAVPDDASCVDLGFYATRKPTCTADCTFDRGSCDLECGDGIVQPEFEICDGSTPTASCVDYGFGAGLLGCVNCGPQTDRCLPFGWSVLDLPGTVADIHGTAPDDVYALHYANGLMHYDGTAWSAVDLSACNVQFPSFSRIWTPVPGVVFAAGATGKLVRVENTTCTVWDLGNGSSLPVTSVWAASATDAWVTVGGNGVWRLVAGTWTKVHSDSYEEVWGTVAGSTYAVYVRNTGVLRKYDGQNWSAEFAPDGIGITTAIWGVSPSEIYVGGVSTDFSKAHVVRYDGASTWTPMLADEPLLAAASSSEVWAGWTVGARTYVGVRKDQQGFVFVHDGYGWSDLDAPTIEARALWASTNGDLLVGTGLPSIAILDGNIRVDRKPSLGTILAALAANAADDVLVVTDHRLYQFDGATWSFASAVTDATDVGAKDGAAFAIGSNGLFVRNANVWSLASGSPAGRSVWPVAADDVWVLNPSTKTMYRWQTGSVVAVPSFPTTNFTYLNDIWGSSANDVFVVGGRNVNSSTTIEPLIQHWNGSAWTEMTPPAMIYNLRGVWGTSASDVFAFGLGGVIHFDGSTWSTLPPIPGNAAANGLWGSAQDLFVATNHGVYRFDGQQWSPVQTGAPGTISLITGIGDSIMFFDGLGGWHQLVRLMPWW